MVCSKKFPMESALFAGIFLYLLLLLSNISCIIIAI